jgi:uncharacterized protein DUF4321
MAMTSRKNSWALFLLILSGIVIGGLIGYLVKDIPYLSWLNYGKEFSIGGANSGIIRLDLDMLIISFGLSIKISLASIIGVIISIIIYKRI